MLACRGNAALKEAAAQLEAAVQAAIAQAYSENSARLLAASKLLLRLQKYLL